MTAGGKLTMGARVEKDRRLALTVDDTGTGISPDKLDLTTTAFPAVEALCLLGLQRFRPKPTDQRRVFEYRAWTRPLSECVASAVTSGSVTATVSGSVQMR